MDQLVQVCTADLTSCEWVPVSDFFSFPALSVADAMLLSSAVFGLFAMVWAFSKIRAAF